MYNVIPMRIRTTNTAHVLKVSIVFLIFDGEEYLPPNFFGSEAGAFRAATISCQPSARFLTLITHCHACLLTPEQLRPKGLTPR